MQKVELTEKMLERIEEIQQAGYKYLKALLEVDDEKMKELGPWTEDDFRSLLADGMSILSKKGLFICNPYIFEEFTPPFRCTLAECKCEECTRQDEFMYKERIAGYMRELLEDAEYEVVVTEEGAIAFKEKGLGNRYQLQVTVQEETVDEKN
ncbi:MAG: hypothetical protein IKJ39_12520 [Lachnospiraceae bacterium]|nr:hypothetical protein [Lachnospiraceae bacterium]MBR3826010.1 hypothetical protein [Lachnospiraceae bacterium]